MSGEQITELFAFVGTDNDGTQGVVAAQTRDGWLPLVGADMARVDSLRELARQISAERGMLIEIMRFSNCEVIGVVLG